ncbi:enoyl-CoA hydratase/isomerase family protein [Sediminivirga luteola]|uniref:3-hydroxyisobutyryl-CoA hydrolase n=1 Tax=Sediminivirga luteola TaxID=1774748 RepID=A0A8J2U1I0_9MICO|nr:enoyl-CoA hydratase/isomerase family protein [Sediminivirga luteola]MCI2265405.1 enoyl-CoA hydratase/isomerase family protein [Sediminivirga luteola]GGA28864.1 3-hydroxyisobutyryl-CoA hydrolase [Sediminivirga luteola]
MTQTQDISTDVRNGLARVELNRPKAINALSEPMVAVVKEALESWRHDDDIRAVLLTGSGERGLCAGGDIKAIHAALVRGSDDPIGFWRTEYAMNLAIAEYPKPYIAVMHGITMGGGLGISAHGSHRIVTDSSKLAMPETGIGLFPDVGITHLFAQMPHGVGEYLGLTGTVIGAGAAIRYGLADAYVEDASLPAFIEALEEGPEDPDAVIARYSAEPPADELAERLSWIEPAFTRDSVEDIIAELHRIGGPAAECATLLEGRSPTSLKVTLAAIRAAAGRSLAETLDADFRIARALTAQPDLLEGIRAQVIDKDRNPQWRPGNLAEVDDAAITKIIEGEG